MKDQCKGCGFLNEYGYCECSQMDKWYACPIESKKPENRKALEEWGKQESDKKKLTYGYCVYHELECDYSGQCVNCPHNTKEDIEWFRQDGE